MIILWTNLTAAVATAGRAQGEWSATRVTIDSRNIQAGDLFVALKGENFDGHDYVADALAKGASAAVVSRLTPEMGTHALLIVDDTLKALEDLALAARRNSRAKVVGVTGSVGKTSAKEMIRLALSAHGETYATSGNTNNHIGTPLNLANMPPSTRFAVFEMGMNHAGEISHLTRMVRPDVAAITTIEAVHMEFFGSIEHIADAKAEIFEGMVVGGVAVLNRDSPLYAHLARRASEQGVNIIVTFGAHEKADCRLIDYKPVLSGCHVQASIHGQYVDYSLQAVGRHWAMASLLTLAVTRVLKLDMEKTVKILANFGELDGRGRILRMPVKGGQALLIDDSYNASPAAMRAAFSKTVEVWESTGRKGRKIAALGNMLELGAAAGELHAGLAADLAQSGFDRVFTAGDLMKHLYNELPSAIRGAHVAQAALLLPLLQKELRDGDILLVKGSHGSKIYELAKALTDKPAASAAMMEKEHAV